MYTKIQETHKNRMACIYVRQSTTNQVRHNQESTQRQYALQGKAEEIGWSPQLIKVMDGDLGLSGASSNLRNDFKALVAEVSMRKVGAVFALEASRLARSCADWHRLLELCALTDTVIVDEDGCYSPADFNDQLLLGLKGTMSQAELHVIRARLQGGKLTKAQRGELKVPLPVGYCYTEQSEIVLDADEQVRHAVKSLFETFRHLGSAHRVAKEFTQSNQLFPKRANGGIWKGKLTWGRLTVSRVLNILKNPCYTGVYSFGRFYSRKEITEDGKIESKQAIRPMGDWIVSIKDHHDSYISFDEFQENQRLLSSNCVGQRSVMHSGAAREGKALLQGIILCGKCGRPMHPQYKSTADGVRKILYRCDWKQREGLGKGCMLIPSALVDEAISVRLLQVIEPEQLKIALAAIEQLEYRESSLAKQWRMKLDRMDYEAQLAQKRYEEVDPSNRLVAATLESRWNDALLRLEEVKQQAAQAEEKHRFKLNENQRDKILRLAQNLPALWQLDTTKPEDKKRIIRLLISDVTVERSARSEDPILHIRWMSGATEDIVTQLEPAMHDRRRYPIPIVERVRELAFKMPDKLIYAALNADGILSPTGKPFTEPMIRWIRHKYQIQPMESKGSNEMIVQEVAHKFGVSKYAVYEWIAKKMLPARKDESGRYLIRLSAAAESRIRNKQQAQSKSS